MVASGMRLVGIFKGVGLTIERGARTEIFFVQYSTYYSPLDAWLVKHLVLATITVSHSHFLLCLRYMKKQLLLRT